MFVTRYSRVATLAVLFLLVSFPVTAQQPSPPDGEARERGIKLYERGDLKAAIKALRQAVRLDKSDGIAWYYLGVAYYRSEKNIDAIKALQTAATLRPDDGAVHTALAYTFLKIAKFDQAKSEATLAITLDDQSAVAHYVLGVISLRESEFGEALKSAERALQIEPSLPFPLLLKSQALVNMLSNATLRIVQEPIPASKLDDSDHLLLKEAAECLEKYLQLKPDTSNASEWREQLESLRYYATLTVDNNSQGASAVYSPNYLTTRARILSKPSPSYTESARVAKIAGTVVLQMLLGEDGNVKHILVLRWLSHGLVNEAKKVASQIKFTPATKDGQPVSQIVRVEYNFNVY